MSQQSGPVSLRHAPLRVLAGHLVVNAVAVALVVALLPGVSVASDHPVAGYVLVGAVLGVINAFVKPAIQFVALPLFMGSMGLVVIIVDAVVFWLLDVISPMLDTDGAGWVFIAAGVLALVSYLLENLVGLTPPITPDRPGRQVPA